MKRRGHQPAHGPTPPLPVTGSGVLSVTEPNGTIVRMRCGAGKYAIAATEAEVHVDGARIAGGNGSFEFDLPQETWLELVIIRA